MGVASPKKFILGTRVRKYSDPFLYMVSQAVATQPRISARGLGIFSSLMFRALINEAKGPRCGFDGEKKTREWSGLDGSGSWGPVFPEAEPEAENEADPEAQVPDPSFELPVLTAADAITNEPLLSPDARPKRSRRAPSRMQ